MAAIGAQRYIPSFLGPLAAAVTLAATLLATTAAQAEQTKAPAAGPSRIAVEVVAKGLAHPWSLTFLPDGRMLVTERAGRIRIVDREGNVSKPLAGVPTVAATGQGGLLDIALAPDFERSRLVYVSFSEPRGDRLNGTSVARARLAGTRGDERLADLEVIFRQEPGHSGGLHFGSRLVFAPDGTLFVTLGERFEMRYAQDLGRHWGKVIRILPDGGVPPDNPFSGQAGARPEIWSYGHRNAQAAAINPATGVLWVIEHGPRGGDEVNIVARGANYGWPVIGYGIDYSGRRLHDATHKEGMQQPLYYWVPSIAPSGMAFYTGDLFPDWRGNVFTGALAGKALHRLVLDGPRVVGEEVLLRERGERIRDVRQGPDGALWLLTDEADGTILRLTPRP
jgi:glucose/arabinose dehydrogenase